MTRNPFAWLEREFAPLFERAFPVSPFEARWETRPAFEMEERENEYVVRVEAPGFEASELEVAVVNNVLTVRAEHPRAEAETTVKRPYARLERVLTLPTGVNLEAIEARCHNGILEIHIPRLPEALPRRIEVKT